MPKRTLIDRFLPYVTPGLVRDFAPPPERLDTSLWILDRRLRMPGGPVLPTRTTIVGLPSGGLLVVSPPPAGAGGLDVLGAIGRVEHVVAPNSFHHLNVAGFLARFPGASFWAAPGLFARVPGLPPGTELGSDAPAEWSGAVEQAILDNGRGVSEVAFFHRESATLVLTDLAFHMVRFGSAFDRVAWRLSGVPAGFGPSRTARLLLLQDPKPVAPFLRRVLAWPFRRVLVAHGDALEEDAAGTFRRAYAEWLSPDA
jgi:hypothetical protein